MKVKNIYKSKTRDYRIIRRTCTDGEVNYYIQHSSNKWYDFFDSQ